MKYLSDYMNDKQTELFNRTGAIFAFSQEQFNEQKKPDVTYVHLGAGMICPVATRDELTEGLATIYREAIKQDLAENGKEGVIKRELYNHEIFVTYDITDTVEALAGYGIDREEIQDVFDKLPREEA